MKRMHVFLLTLLLTFVMGTLSATLLLEDNFTGTVGSSLTIPENGWSLHSGTGTPFLISSPGLTYTGYQGSDIGNAASTGGTSDDINKAFASTNSGTLYYSFMYKPTSASLTTDHSVGFGNTSGASVTGFFGRLYVQRDASNNLRFGVSKQTGTVAYTDYIYSLNTTYLIVLKFEFVAGTANDIASLFVNPSLGGSEPTPTLVNTVDTSGDPAQLTSACFRQSANTAGAIYDGVKIGTVWADIAGSGAPTPTITMDPATLTGFTYVLSNGPSTEQTFTISGADLTGNISIAASTNYEISKTTLTGYTTPLTFTPAEVATPQTVYVRLKAGLAVAEYNSEVITASSDGAADKTVTCSGTVTSPDPVITVNPGALTGFTYIVGTGPSAYQTFTVSGINLAANLTVSPTTNYEVSLNNVDYATPVSLVPASGEVTSTIIYVRLKSGLGVAAYNGENIVAASGAVFQNVTCSGAVIAPPTPDIFMEENFDYVQGTYLKDNGWTAHSGAGTNPPIVGNTNLTYAGYPLSLGLCGETVNNGEDVHKTFTNQTTGSVYVSFLINVTSSTEAGDYVFHFGPNPIGTDFKAKFFVGRDVSNNVRFGLTKSANVGTAVAWTGYNYAYNTTYLVVLKYAIVNGLTNDIVTAWINPDFSGSEPTPLLSAVVSETDIGGVGSVGIRQSNAALTAKFDGIRVTNDWQKLFESVTYTGEIVVDPATLTDFSAVAGTPSTTQSYQLSGLDLTSDFIDVSVTGPFQIAELNSMVWGTELTNLFSFNTYEILVRYNPTEAGTHNGTITHSVLNGEAAPVYISLTGTATPATQTITVAPVSMTFTTNSGTTSAAQMATVEGINLVTGITVASSGEYSFSATEGGVYANPYQITTGYNGTSNVWIKFSPTTIGTFNNTITFSSGTAEQKTIAVTGYSLDPNATYATDLFFSEYIEGSSNNKAIEIFNGTGHDVDLADYTVYLYSNGAGAATPTNTLAMTGILAHNDVYIIANASANATILALADVTSSVTFFNGDDAISLWKESTAAYVDIFGVIGSDPGTAWIDGAHTTLDRTLVRISSVIGGVTVNPSGTGPLAFTTLTTEWDVYAIDTVSNLGTHYFTPGLLPAEAPVIMPLGGVQVGPITVSMSTTTPGGVIWYTLDGTDPTNAAPSIMYTGSFGISMDTTVKARTFATGFAYSPITTVVYTFPVITNVPNIAALRAITPGTGAYYKLTGEAILTLKSSSRNSKYIQDATGAVLIDDPTGKITTTYNLGDGITNIIGTLALFNRMLQFTPATDPGPATSTGNIVVPLEVTTVAVTDTTYQAKLVKLSGVTITGTGNFTASTSYPIADAAGVGTLRDQYPDLDYIGTPIPTTPKDIVGVMLQNNTIMQFVPRSLAEFTDPAALDAPVTAIFLTGGQVELSWAAITGATGYKVYATDDPYATFPGAWTLLTPAPITALTYTYTGTENYKFFKVTANN